ncbi:MAG: hypothetical protein NZ534_03845, partial [Bacteroidia bacterium]|nr:hypothetical protein [Bacteroidia bacterium]
MIEEVIVRFGPRRAGTESERRAQEYFLNVWSEFADFVRLHEFRVPLRAKFGLLKPVFLLYGLSLAAVWIFPALGLLLSAAAA